MVGSIIQGLGAALYEQIEIENGEVRQRNFDDYRVVRMTDLPEIELRIIPTDNPPGGIGEVGVPPVAPAIANAVARLPDGLRLRHMPFLPERVRAALEG